MSSPNLPGNTPVWVLTKSQETIKFFFTIEITLKLL